jgi:F0F1-type ATP synthase membrane subunit c/vacuolar-type H+-ATPase subunit K
LIGLLSFLHYTAASFLVVVPAMAVAYSQGRSAQATLDAIDEQPKAAKSLLTCMLIGSVLNETAALLSVIMGVALLIGSTELTMPIVVAELGIVCAIGIPAVCVGLFSMYPHIASIGSVARQPFQSGRINYFLAFVLSMMQMSVILGLIVAFLMKSSIKSIITMQDAIKIVSMGIAFGVSTIGPLLGMRHFTGRACAVLGYSPDAYSPLVSFALVSQALIETPILFSLFISLLLFFKAKVNPWAALAAAFSMGLSTVGPGIASGVISGAACQSIGAYPERASLFSYASVLAQTLVDAAVVYGVIIATALILGN